MVLLSPVIDMYSREPLGHSAVDMADFSVWGGSTAVRPDRLFGRCRTLPTSLWTLILFLNPCSIYLIYSSLVQCLLGVIHPWVPQDFTPILSPIPVRVNLNNGFMERRAPPFLAQTSLHPIYWFPLFVVFFFRLASEAQWCITYTPRRIPWDHGLLVYRG